MKHYFFILYFSLIKLSTLAQDVIQYNVREDVPYYEMNANSDSYTQERCKLDVYYPVNKKNFATVVWFHGGGLTGGEKEIPEALKQQGMAVIGVGYRLSPRAKGSGIIEDAAAATAWVFKHIKDFGGSDKLIYISGHSAGGYLAMMVTLNSTYLSKYNINANLIAAAIPFSGHTITHFTIRKERGIRDVQAVVDEYAPLFHVRADAPPLLLITGDRELEMLGRYEENAYMARMMKLAGHKRTSIIELGGYGHNMTYPAFPLLIKEINQRTKEIIHTNQ